MIQFGASRQILRLLPPTSIGIPYIINRNGCPKDPSLDNGVLCDDARGGTLIRDNSSIYYFTASDSNGYPAFVDIGFTNIQASYEGNTLTLNSPDTSTNGSDINKNVDKPVIIWRNS